MNKLELEQIAGGALQEKVDVAMKHVIENMQDPNTPWKNKRSITIKLAFTQNEDRDDTAVDISVETKTAPVTPIVTRMMIGRDIESGECFAQEYGKQVRGQMSLEDMQKEQIIGTDVVDTDTGEIIGNIKNFRAVKEA